MDKKISIFVETVVAGAKRKLQEVEGALKNLGTASERSADAMGGAAGNWIDYIDRMEAETKKDTTSMVREMGKLEQAGTILEGAIRKLGILAVAYLTKMAVRSIKQMSRMAAANLDLEDSYKRVATQYGMASDEILAALDKAAKGTVDKYSLMIQANKALRLGVATTVDEFEQLMKIAVVRAKEFGLTTAQAFNFIVTAIGRASPMIADNIGILLDANATYDEYARSIDKTADQLTILEQKEAIRNRILREGIPDMEAWNDMGVTAADVFQQYDATMVELRQEMGERFLPVVIKLTSALVDLQKASQGYEQDTRDVVSAVLDAGGTVDDAVKALEKHNQATQRGRPGLIDWREAIEGITVAEKNLAIVQDVVASRWGQMHQESAAARLATLDAGDAIEDTTQDTEELGKALQKGADIWADYGRRVEEANYQFARKVEDAQFRATQALENAAFRRYEIERNASERRGDLLTQYDIRLEADTAAHYNRLRYMRQDLLDDLSDMEYDFQQEKKRLLEQAPWWIRNALGKEFAERARIAKTGDKKALAEYDKALLAKIKAIDPAYAKEFQKLTEQHKRKTKAEKREAGQAQERQREDWSIRSREQEQSLRLQLSSLDRSLNNQLEAWRFHEAQREETERRSMGRIHDGHDHALAAMYENTQRRLAEITPLWEYYGNEWGMALIRGMATGQMYSPATGYDPSTFVNPFAGGASPTFGAGAPAVAAAGANINVEVNVGGGWTPYQAQEVGTVVATKLGQMTRRQAR